MNHPINKSQDVQKTWQSRESNFLFLDLTFSKVYKNTQLSISMFLFSFSQKELCQYKEQWCRKEIPKRLGSKWSWCKWFRKEINMCLHKFKCLRCPSRPPPPPPRSVTPWSEHSQEERLSFWRRHTHTVKKDSSGEEGAEGPQAALTRWSGTCSQGSMERRAGALAHQEEKIHHTGPVASAKSPKANSNSIHYSFWVHWLLAIILMEA